MACARRGPLASCSGAPPTEVEREIDAAAEYYDAERVGLGALFLDAIDEAIARLVEFPESHAFAPATLPGEEIRQVVVRRYPYRIIYKLRATDLLVLACMHAGQEPGYWRARAR